MSISARKVPWWQSDVPSEVIDTSGTPDRFNRFLFGEMEWFAAGQAWLDEWMRMSTAGHAEWACSMSKERSARPIRSAASDGPDGLGDTASSGLRVVHTLGVVKPDHAESQLEEGNARTVCKLCSSCMVILQSARSSHRWMGWLQTQSGSMSIQSSNCSHFVPFQ